MRIQQITIKRVIVHEIIKPSQILERPPVFSQALVTLDNKGTELVAKRLIDSIGDGSLSVEVDVEDHSKGSPFDLATGMLDATKPRFIALSQKVADLLAKSQVPGAVKSGVGLFVQGECKVNGQERRFLAIIKADSDQALVRSLTDDGIDLSYVSETFLGAQQRLIKIAFFFELMEPDTSQEIRPPAAFSILVFDHLLQPGGGDLAEYFYGTFLKCRISQDASRKTLNFFEITREFINAMDCSADEKMDLYAALGTYLRSNDKTIHPRTFAQAHMPTEAVGPYVAACRSERMTSAFAKDTSLLSGRLKKFSLRFTSEVVISAPQETWKESVKIIETKDGWTTLKILGEIKTVRQ